MFLMGILKKQTIFISDEVILNGDDVPLVEEMVEDLLDDNSVESPKLAVNGDNFMDTVMTMNKALSTDEKLRENIGLKSAQKKSQNVKKIENGLGVIAVNEEDILSKKVGSVKESRAL